MVSVVLEVWNNTHWHKLQIIRREVSRLQQKNRIQLISGHQLAAISEDDESFVVIFTLFSFFFFCHPTSFSSFFNSILVLPNSTFCGLTTCAFIFCAVVRCGSFSVCKRALLLVLVLKIWIWKCSCHRNEIKWRQRCSLKTYGLVKIHIEWFSNSKKWVVRFCLRPRNPPLCVQFQHFRLTKRTFDFPKLLISRFTEIPIATLSTFPPFCLAIIIIKNWKKFALLRSYY